MLISVHIPKTAGSTFRRVLEHTFKNRIFVNYLDYQQFEEIEKPGLSLLVRRYSSKMLRLRRVWLSKNDKCIHGHFSASKYLDKYPSAHLVTWVRDPVDRVVSHYYYWKKHPDLTNVVCREFINNNLGLLEFASLPEMRDVQSKYISDVSLKRFDFIGIQEHFDKMLPLFFKKFNLPEYYPESVNVNKKAVGKYDIDDKIWHEIDQLNSEDRKLYNFALTRYMQLTKEYNGSQEKI